VGGVASPTSPPHLPWRATKFSISLTSDMRPVYGDADSRGMSIMRYRGTRAGQPIRCFRDPDALTAASLTSAHRDP
jgi:hypothetical protein